MSNVCSKKKPKYKAGTRKKDFPFKEMTEKDYSAEEMIKNMKLVIFLMLFYMNKRNQNDFLIWYDDTDKVNSLQIKLQRSSSEYFISYIIEGNFIPELNIVFICSNFY